MVSPNHPWINRVFHYFHHPFWGPTPIFGNTHINNKEQPMGLNSTRRAGPLQSLLCAATPRGATRKCHPCGFCSTSTAHGRGGGQQSGYVALALLFLEGIGWRWWWWWWWWWWWCLWISFACIYLIMRPASSYLSVNTQSNSPDFFVLASMEHQV